MSGTITMAGLASGMDVEGIITGLVNANSVAKQQLQTRESSLQSASSTVSDVGTALSSLRSSIDVLSSLQSAASYSATSDSTAVVASVTGAASSTSFSIDVKQLATTQRTYSASVADRTAALGEAGTLQIQVGTGTPASVSITSDDTLDTISAKINGAGLRVASSVFWDGTAYRLQVRGLDTGAANGITFTESGTTLDLAGDGSNPDGGKTVQQAQDSKSVIDGYTITRPTNQLVGVVPGVTLALSAQTTSPATVTVASDASTLQSRVQAVVTAFNSVISKVQTATGYGTSAATNSLLAADPSLRGVATRLSQWATSSIGGTGSAYSRLADIGVSIQKDGTLGLDTTKLQSAISSDADSVAKLLAKPLGSTTGGAAGGLESIIDSLTAADTGALAGRKDSLDAQAKQLGDEVTSEQSRLDAYTAQLRAQFQAMDASITASKTMGQQIDSFFNVKSSSSSGG